MAAADVDLQLDTPARIRFAQNPWKAVGFAALSLGFTLLCWFAIRDNDAVRYGFTAFSMLFLGAGVAGIFWRMELDIDLVRRRVRRVRGWWPNPQVAERDLDEADGVWLDMDYRSTGTGKNRRKVPWWMVSLKFPEEKNGTRLFVTRKEVDGYRKWEYYAERLSLSAVDDTTAERQRKAPDVLDDRLAGALATGSASPPLPVRPLGSKAALVVDGGCRALVMPPLGLSAGLVMLLLFGAAFVALGMSVLLASLGLIHMQVEGSPWATRLIPPLFVLLGLGIIWLGIKGSVSALVLGVDGGALYTEQLAFGRRSGRESVPLVAIEAVEIGGDTGSRRRRGARIKIAGIEFGAGRYRERESEVVVRSDEKILRFGRFLSEEEKAWLADVCRYAAHHGRMA